MLTDEEIEEVLSLADVQNGKGTTWHIRFARAIEQLVREDERRTILNFGEHFDAMYDDGDMWDFLSLVRANKHNEALEQVKQLMDTARDRPQS